MTTERKIWATLFALVVGLMLLGGKGCDVSWPVNPTPTPPVVVVPAAPFKTDKLSGLIIYDASPEGIAKLSKGQRDVIEGNSDSSVRGFFRNNGGYELQAIDFSHREVDFSYPWMKEAVAIEMKTYPWMVVATPKSGDSFPLPADVTTDVVTAKLQRIVGAK